MIPQKHRTHSTQMLTSNKIDNLEILKFVMFEDLRILLERFNMSFHETSVTPIYIIQYARYIIHYTAYTLHFTLFIIQYNFNTILFTYTRYTAHYTFYTSHHPLYTLHCTLYTVHSAL